MGQDERRVSQRNLGKNVGLDEHEAGSAHGSDRIALRSFQSNQVCQAGKMRQTCAGQPQSLLRTVQPLTLDVIQFSVVHSPVTSFIARSMASEAPSAAHWSTRLTITAKRNSLGSDSRKWFTCSFGCVGNSLRSISIRSRLMMNQRAVSRCGSFSGAAKYSSMGRISSSDSSAIVQNRAASSELIVPNAS